MNAEPIKDATINSAQNPTVLSAKDYTPKQDISNRLLGALVANQGSCGTVRHTE